MRGHALMRAYCERDDRLAFIDVDQAMLGWDEAAARVGREDGLHLTAQGYAVWSACCGRSWARRPSDERPSIENAWGTYAPQAHYRAPWLFLTAKQ